MKPTPPLTFVQAVALEEGFYVDGSRPQRNNNPGDLEWRPWQATYGATKGDPRFAIFPTPELGFAALKHLCGFPIYKGKTISEFAGIFAPSNENNSKQYALNIASWTEKDLNTVIDGILG